MPIYRSPFHHHIVSTTFYELSKTKSTWKRLQKKSVQLRFLFSHRTSWHPRNFFSSLQVTILMKWDMKSRFFSAFKLMALKEVHCTPALLTPIMNFFHDIFSTTLSAVISNYVILSLKTEGIARWFHESRHSSECNVRK